MTDSKRIAELEAENTWLKEAHKKSEEIRLKALEEIGALKSALTEVKKEMS